MAAADDITITAIDPPGSSVTGKAAQTPPTATSEGGWAFVARPRRTAYTWWNGVEPYTLTIPMVFDNYLISVADKGLASVEGPLNVLRGMFRNRVGPRNEPAVVAVFGAVIPLPGLTWVIQNIEFGDEIRDDSTGALARAFVTVTLLQYEGADVIAGPAEQANAIASGAVSTAAFGAASAAAVVGSAGSTHVVQAGEDLTTIATLTLGSFSRWHDIADLNGIRDPTQVTVGQVLKLPA